MLLVEKEFQSVGDKHEIEYNAFVLWVVTRNANNISNMLGVLRY